MATLIRVVRGVGRAVQKAHREQERQARRIHAEKIRQEKARLRQSIQTQKQIEKGHREQVRANRELQRQAKRIHVEQVRQEKEHQKQLIERGKSALAARVERRKQLKDSMLNLKVNT